MTKHEVELDQQKYHYLSRINQLKTWNKKCSINVSRYFNRLLLVDIKTNNGVNFRLINACKHVPHEPHP